MDVEFMLKKINMRFCNVFVMVVLCALCIITFNKICMAHIGTSDMVIGNINVNTTIESVLLKFGKPDERYIFYNHPRYDGELQNVTYKDKIYIKSLNKKIIYCNVNVVGMPTAAGIQVGDPINKAIGIYGKPDFDSRNFGKNVDSGVIHYTAVEDERLKLTIDFKNGIVTSISFIYDVPMTSTTSPMGTIESEQLKVGPLRLTMNMSQVLDMYGPPKTYRQRVADYGNGVKIQYFEDSISSQIHEISISTKSYSTPLGINIGMSTEKMLNTYGKPAVVHELGDKCDYIYFGRGADRLKELIFKTNHDNIREICLHWAD